MSNLSWDGETADKRPVGGATRHRCDRRRKTGVVRHFIYVSIVVSERRALLHFIYVSIVPERQALLHFIYVISTRKTGVIQHFIYVISIRKTGVITLYLRD